MYQIKLMRLNEGEVLIEEITSEDLGGRMIIDFFERLPNVFLPVCGVAPVMTEAMMVRICPHKGTALATLYANWDEATQKYLDFMPTFQWHDDLQHLQHRLVTQGYAKHDHVLIQAESLF